MAEHVLTTEVIRAYAKVSHDHNPLHVDEAAAARSPFGSIVVHGFLLLGGVLVEMAARDAYPKSLECRFLSPGRPGDQPRTEFDNQGAFIVRIRGDAAVTGRVVAEE